MHSEIHIGEQILQNQARMRQVASVSVVLAVVWILGWYWRTSATIVTKWYQSETFAHGFLVVPIVIFLIWRDRRDLSSVAIRPCPYALAGLAVLGFGWLIADSAAVLGGTQFMIVGMIPFVVWSILGTDMVRALAFPLGFLFFAVPFGEFVVPTLMDWTADFTIAALRLSGIPVFREGNAFSIPSGNWSVVEACSGVRYLIASVVIGVLYARLTYQSFFRRVVFIGVSFLVPLLANWVRAYSIVMIGHLSGNRLAVGVDHIIYGWFFFGVVMTLLFWIASFWREDDKSRPASAATGSGTGAVEAGPRAVIVMLTALVVIGIWRPIAVALESPQSTSPPQLALQPADGWTMTPGALDGFRPDFTNPVAEASQTFAKGAARIGVFVALYRNQSQASELISSSNQLVTTLNKKWSRTRSGFVDAILGAAKLRVATAELRSSQDRLVVRQWYWVDGWLTSSDIVAKAYLGVARLLGRPGDAAVVVIYTAMEGSVETADLALAQFMVEMGDPVLSMLSKAASP